MPPTLQPQSDVTTGPLQVYKQAVSQGALKKDAAQLAIMQQLQMLYTYIAQPTKAGLLERLIPRKPKGAPHSIYIWGEVGRGKSMLMDMFYSAFTPPASKRIHFHAFMTHIHAAIHQFRQQQSDENPVEHVARELARETRLLCLDEFQVTDVADAMILSKLFETMLECKVYFVLTSNRPPQELYKGGLQREKFLEFVTLVDKNMDILHLTSPYDYRMQQIRALDTVYLCPDDTKADKQLDSIFAKLTHNSSLSPIVLDVQGRKLTLNETYGSIAKTSFTELCEMPLGKADYLAIARRFNTVLLAHIPKLGPEKRNECKRFVTLIDVLYDQKVKLICSAEVPPDQLYTEGDGAFEFERTVSRLAEMQSQSYLATTHIT